MALNLIEQYQVINNQLKPSAVTIPILELVRISAINEGQDFATGHKAFPIRDDQGRSINQAAESYKNKMLGKARIFREQEFQFLVKVLSGVLAEMPSVDASSIQGATPAQWIAFIRTNTYESLEFLAEVTQEEKAAYDAI